MIKSYSKNGKKLYEVIARKRDSLGREHCRKKKDIASQREAKEIEFQLKTQLHKLTTGQCLRWTWKDWHQECLKRMKLSLKNSTINNYDGRLKKWLPRGFTDKYLEDIKIHDVHELLFETIGERTSLHSLKSLLKMMKRIFEMAVEEGILSKNPALGVQVKVPKPEQKVLNSKEAMTLLDEAFKTDHRFYKVWAFALMTGMRSGEMFALCWKDIDLQTGLISINKQWTNKDGLAPPKNREIRVIPVNRDLRTFLNELKAKKESHRQEFWDSRSKTRITLNDLVLPRLKEWENGEQAQVLKGFCKAIGITVIRFHDLRATFITNMLSRGVPLVQVMSIVGHRKMSTTDEYLRLAGVSVNGATEKIGYRLPERKFSHGNILSLSSFQGLRKP